MNFIYIISNINKYLSCKVYAYYVEYILELSTLYMLANIMYPFHI